MAEITKRQPRSGTRSNKAKYVKSGSRYNVQLLDLSVTTETYKTVFSVESESRASTICDRLNSIFSNSRADLDFITPGYSNGYYVVLWSGTTWLGSSTYTEKTENGETYEDLYRGCKLPYFTSSGTANYKYKDGAATNIVTVTDADVSYTGSKKWEIALDWANKIRNVVNGWNCSKSGTMPLHQNGQIYRLASMTGSYSKTMTGVAASYYGAGEKQPAITTANNDIFHTLDLTVAIPKGNSPGLTLNTWVKVTYGGTSVVARVTDECGTTKVDLSTGLANALGYKSGNVTLSKP